MFKKFLDELIQCFGSGLAWICTMGALLYPDSCVRCGSGSGTMQRVKRRLSCNSICKDLYKILKYYVVVS